MWEDIIGKKERGAEKKLKKVAGNEQEYIILALRFFLKKITLALRSQSPVLVCAKWMLTPPLQKKITHVPVGVFFGLILVLLFACFFFLWCTKQQILCFS